MKPVDQQRARLMDLLRRHVRETDALLSDDAFVRAVLGRHEEARAALLIDPNE